VKMGGKKLSVRLVQTSDSLRRLVHQIFEK
jgi:hypothetical protein